MSTYLQQLIDSKQLTLIEAARILERINLMKDSFDKSVNLYIKAFEEKHDIEFDYWVADIVGSIAMFGDYFFDFLDIKYDIDNFIEEKEMFNWYNFRLDSEKKVNYSSWCRGYKDLV